MTVSESIPGNPERILNVSGNLDAVAKVGVEQGELTLGIRPDRSTNQRRTVRCRIRPRLTSRYHQIHHPQLSHGKRHWKRRFQDQGDSRSQWISSERLRGDASWIDRGGSGVTSTQPKLTISVCSLSLVSPTPSTLPCTTSVPSSSNTRNVIRALLPVHTVNKALAVDPEAEAEASTEVDQAL